MSKQKLESVNLPKLQKNIVLKLAEKGAMNVRETNKELNGEYTSTNRAFHELEKKGIIKEVDVKEYRGRKFRKYWLTEDGVVSAFIMEAPKDKLFENAKKFYPNNENLQYFIRFSSILNPQVFKIGYDAVKRKGKLEPIDLFTIMFTQAQSDVSMEKFKEGLKLLKEYPKLCESFKQIIKNWDKVIGLITEELGP